MWKDWHVSLDPTNTHRSFGDTWFLTQLTMVLKMVLMVLMVLKMVQVEMELGSSLQRAAVHGWMPSTTPCDSIQSTPSLLDRPVSQSTMRECFGTYCSIGHPVCPLLQYCLLFSCLFNTFMTTRESLLFDELQCFTCLLMNYHINHMKHCLQQKKLWSAHIDTTQSDSKMKYSTHITCS